MTPLKQISQAVGYYIALNRRCQSGKNPTFWSKALKKQNISKRLQACNLFKRQLNGIFLHLACAILQNRAKWCGWVLVQCYFAPKVGDLCKKPLFNHNIRYKKIFDNLLKKSLQLYISVVY